VADVPSGPSLTPPRETKHIRTYEVIAGIRELSLYSMMVSRTFG
jgi:hypothetical protein